MGERAGMANFAFALRHRYNANVNLEGQGGELCSMVLADRSYLVADSLGAVAALNE